MSLSRFILDNPTLLRDRVVADIGCGSGIVSIAAAMTGARVKSIDRDIASLYFTELNAELNQVEVDILWGNFNDALKYDIIIMSSLFYDAGNKDRIIQTIKSKKVIIGSYKNSIGNHLESSIYKDLTRVAISESKDLEVYHNL